MNKIKKPINRGFLKNIICLYFLSLFFTSKKTNKNMTCKQNCCFNVEIYMVLYMKTEKNMKKCAFLKIKRYKIISIIINTIERNDLI